jgi:hypothetical protein
LRHIWVWEAILIENCDSVVTNQSVPKAFHIGIPNICTIKGCDISIGAYSHALYRFNISRAFSGTHRGDVQVKSKLRSEPSALNSVIDICIVFEAFSESTIVSIGVSGSQELGKLFILVSISCDGNHKPHKGKEHEETEAVCALSLFDRAVLKLLHYEVVFTPVVIIGETVSNAAHFIYYTKI